MEAYSKEFRRDVLRECYSGKGTHEVALTRIIHPRMELIASCCV